MFTQAKQFLKINEDVFLIKRLFKEEDIKNIDPIKEWTESDHVFKKDGILYFCEKIQELEEIIEEQVIEQITQKIETDEPTKSD